MSDAHADWRRMGVIFDSTREVGGRALGHLLAPGIALVSRSRRARMFHPDGITMLARVDPIASASDLSHLGARLAGGALARFSGALWRRGFEHLDVLGIALRFRDAPLDDAQARPGDQDILFATIRSPFTMPFAPLSTDAGDFMGNRYWAVSPFEVAEAGRVKFRLSPATPPARSHASREGRLEAAVASGSAHWTLEARRTWSFPWSPVAILSLVGIASLDQAALRFSPFQCGRGIVPRGFVHAMRRPAYAASQGARPPTSAFRA